MKFLQERLLLSDKGYSDLKKAIFACTLTNHYAFICDSNSVVRPAFKALYGEGDILVNYVGTIGIRSACNNPGLYRCQE